MNKDSSILSFSRSLIDISVYSFKSNDISSTPFAFCTMVVGEQYTIICSSVMRPSRAVHIRELASLNSVAAGGGFIAALN